MIFHVGPILQLPAQIISACGSFSFFPDGSDQREILTGSCDYNLATKAAKISPAKARNSDALSPSSDFSVIGPVFSVDTRCQKPLR